MNNKLKKLLKKWRVIALIVFILFALISIQFNPWSKGVAIRSVALNSSALIAGIQNPKPTLQPMSREKILAIDNINTNNLADYSNTIKNFRVNNTYQIKTNKGLYKLTIKEKIKEIELNETETKIIEEIIQVNETINNTIIQTNKTINKTITIPKIQRIPLGPEDIGLRVYDAPTSNIRKGLDLEGGTRVLLQPEKNVSSQDIETIKETMAERLNVYGLSDIILRIAGDLSGNKYILVEVAGANEEEVKDLLEKQGKFESKIGNNTVFIGGQDIKYVCRSADCAGLDPQYGCGQSQGNWFCRFRFSISISKEAAQRQGTLTSGLDVVTENKEKYLSQKLILFLDDKQVDELNIAADLKGRTDVTEIAISGSGIGSNQQEATYNAMTNMKRLQTILVTGSLPVKLNIIKTDTISPILGKEFVNNALLMGLISLLAVGAIIQLRYRRLRISIPMFLSLSSELVILLGMASLIKWNLDLASIAGIILVIGTGVDQLIVITDEILRGEISQIFNWKERIKSAIFIIMGSYFTVFVAMVPLIFAGAGLLKGFAITTIIGASVGVLVVRPTFASVIEILLKE